MSLLKKGERVADLTIEERAVLWLHKHYPNIEVVDLEAASKPESDKLFFKGSKCLIISWCGSCSPITPVEEKKIFFMSH